MTGRTAPRVHTVDLPADNRGWALVVHGGAGGHVPELPAVGPDEYAAGLAAAYGAGEEVLAAGGAALDAVCAAVTVLEDNPLFNAGRGAALTAEGRAEHDACVMTGTGDSGAVAASHRARNPVLAARAVMERTPHVLLVSPDEATVSAWGLATADPSYFVTDARRTQLDAILAAQAEPARHGTVGAVARDRTGRIAAATSTGGIAGQWDGRIGDTPIVGAGTFAADGVVGLSCTGEGEAFVRGVVAHDVAARMAYGGVDLRTAVEDTVAAKLTERGAEGGLIAIDATGRVALAHNSPMMFSAYHDGDKLVTTTGPTS